MMSTMKCTGSALHPIVNKFGDHSPLCKCVQCTGNAPKVVRCAAFIPGGIQCNQEMYHAGSCTFEPVIPFSTHLPR